MVGGAVRRAERDAGDAGDDRRHRQVLAPPRPLPQPRHPEPEQHHQAARQARLDHGQRRQQQRRDLQRPAGQPEQRRPQPPAVAQQPPQQREPQRVVVRDLARLQRLQRDRGVVEDRGPDRGEDARAQAWGETMRGAGRARGGRGFGGLPGGVGCPLTRPVVAGASPELAPGELPRQSQAVQGDTPPLPTEAARASDPGRRRRASPGPKLPGSAPASRELPRDHGSRLSKPPRGRGRQERRGSCRQGQTKEPRDAGAALARRSWFLWPAVGDNGTTRSEGRRLAGARSAAPASCPKRDARSVGEGRVTL